jgi:hypothetical protein
LANPKIYQSPPPFLKQNITALNFNGSSLHETGDKKGVAAG